jgi:hypothetical protein
MRAPPRAPASSWSGWSWVTWLATYSGRSRNLVRMARDLNRLLGGIRFGQTTYS